MMFKYCVEAWTYRCDEEASHEEEMVLSAEFEEWDNAAQWCMDRMEEGYQTRLYKR